MEMHNISTKLLVMAILFCQVYSWGVVQYTFKFYSETFCGLLFETYKFSLWVYLEKFMATVEN